jgi:hypothetical protein
MRANDAIRATARRIFQQEWRCNLSGKELAVLGSVMAADVLSALNIPGGSTIAEVTRRYVEKKRTEAVEVLIAEISHGYHGPIHFDEHDIEPLIGIVFRLSKAVADGAALENLKLLAQVICGLKKNKALSADAFQRWCGVLEGLTRDEIVVIGNAFAARRHVGSDAPITATNGFWQELKRLLAQAGYKNGEIYALCTAVSRTGLLMPEAVLNGTVFGDTPWLVELGALAVLRQGVRT